MVQTRAGPILLPSQGLFWATPACGNQMSKDLCWNVSTTNARSVVMFSKGEVQAETRPPVAIKCRKFTPRATCAGISMDREPILAMRAKDILVAGGA